MQGCFKQGEGEAKAKPPGCFSGQLTLSQPGGRLCPSQYYKPPPTPSGFSDLTTALSHVTTWESLIRIETKLTSDEGTELLKGYP